MDLKTFVKKIFGTLEHEVKTEVDRFKNQQQARQQQQMYQQQQQSYQQQQQQYQQPQQQYQQPQQAPQPERSDLEWMAYFREILATEFSQYGVRENVPVQELTGYVSDEFDFWGDRRHQVYKAEWGKPYDFVMYLNGVPKAAIVFGRKTQHKDKVTYLISRMYAKKLNMVYIGFYLQFPNYRPYVVNRIKEHLR